MIFKRLSFFLFTLVFLQSLQLTQAATGTKPEVIFETSMGSFTIELYPDKAPLTVANFLAYIDAGFYDNTIFHRVVKDFVIQGGGFDTDMQPKQTRKAIRNESDNLLKNIRGSLSMARRTHPDTATSQFFVNLTHNARLDYVSEYQPGYTVFGRISQGMDVIDRISVVETAARGGGQNVPVEHVVILSAKRKQAVAPAPAGKEAQAPGKTPPAPAQTENKAQVPGTEPAAPALAEKEAQTPGKEPAAANQAEKEAQASGNKPAVRAQQAAPAEQQQVAFVAGEHYVVLDKPVATRDSSRIEVVEMFSYGCPHCYEFEPLVKQWGTEQGGDVDFWFFPAVWSKAMKLYAQAFYTAIELGVAERVHMPLFRAIVVDQRSIRNEDDMAAFFAGYGVTEAAFKEVFRLDKVKRQVAEAEQRVRDYQPAGVPEIVVNGKYRIDRARAGGYDEMLKVVEYLVEKERAARIQ